MDEPTLEQLVSIRAFPAVVHPRHARELLTADEGALGEWTAGYAITVPDHRRMLEELLGSLAWGDHGQAALITGLYGAGKSHLLVLLHLLAAHPRVWPCFLEGHPEFRRYAEPAQSRRRLVVHFSLDEYGPRQSLEEAALRETSRALGADLSAESPGGASRLDTWGAALEAARAAGCDGLLILIDELSMFLAGRSPARREADAAFLQFMAGWTGRAPVWVIGALQRSLPDVGPLRTHSWRQVEDRFRRYALSPQQLGDVLREKLLRRTDAAAVRELVASEIAPAAERAGLPYPAGEFQRQWPFHPEAIDLLVAVVNGHLSPHRGAVEVFARLGEPAWMGRPAGRLITVLDLFQLIADDLRAHAEPDRLWRAFDLLRACAEETSDPGLAGAAITLLALLHLAERPASVAQLRALLFDGVSAPAVGRLAEVLHELRRRAAYLTVLRDADAADEVFALALGDEEGALALARMEEARRELTLEDRRIVQAALEACTDPGWPLGPAVEGMAIGVPWLGSERRAAVTAVCRLSEEVVARSFEGLAAGTADAHALILWPGAAAGEGWRQAAAGLDGPYARTLILWRPREATAAERELWTEYAGWQRAAADPLPAASGRERRVRQRCRERAEELRPAVEASLRALYREGRWSAASGDEGAMPSGTSLAEVLSRLLADGFRLLFPLFPMLSPEGTPTRAACQQLLAGFIEPGEARLGAQSLISDYVERFAIPLGCAEVSGPTARVTPPRWDILEPVLARLEAGPLRAPEVSALLRRPPLGLMAEQAQLVIAAAVRTGALQALDGFLQPLRAEEISIARSDAVAFLGPPTLVDLRYKPVIRLLADRWGFPADPWPIACSQAARRLGEWLTTWAGRLAEARGAVAEWSGLLQTFPWAWQGVESALATLERALDLCDQPLAARLEIVGEAGEGWLDRLDGLWPAVTWWKAEREGIRALLGLADGIPGVDAAGIRDVLARGEGSFGELPALGERIAAARQAYRQIYARWHEELFGPAMVAALREAFEAPDFRAVKALGRLPLPLPEGAVRCLDALARARSRYCPGVFAALEADGLCARCRLPLGSPSPMPDAAEVRQSAGQAMEAYAALLREDPWADHVRARLPRAPQPLAARAQAFLDWRAADGPAALLALLEESLIAWLCRDRPAAGVRHLAHLVARLRGRDLTLGEAREAVQGWLDPEGTLDDEATLAFE